MDNPPMSSEPIPIPDTIRPPAVGERLRIIREARGLKTRKSVYDPLGIDGSLYSRYERGKTEVPRETLWRLAQFHGIPVEYLFEGSTHRLPLDLAKKIGAA